MSTLKIGDMLISLVENNAELAESIGSETKFQLKSLLESQIEKLELVTREEFDASQASLERALKRIEELEHQIGAKND